MGRPRKWASDAERKAAGRSSGAEQAEYDRRYAEAVELGRRYGLDECRRLVAAGRMEDLTCEAAEDRVARAVRYAVWVFEGKPFDGVVSDGAA